MNPLPKYPSGDWQLLSRIPDRDPELAELNDNKRHSYASTKSRIGHNANCNNSVQ